MNDLNVTWRRDRGGLVVPVAPGIHLDPGRGTSLSVRAEAISRLLPPEVVVARRTAAWVWGLDVLPPSVKEAEWEVDLVLAPGSVPPGSDPRWVELPTGHVVEESGVRVTSLARTALDCVRWLPRLDAIAALDQFLRRGAGPSELLAMARSLKGYRGNRRLRELLSLGDRKAESPGESWTRLMVVDAGFPCPQSQIPVMCPFGGSLYIDLGYAQYQVGVEYDGEAHHTGPRARAHDEARRRWLRKDMGWDIIPVTKDFLPKPGPYLEALLTALLQRGWDPDDAAMDRIAAHLARLQRRRR